MAFQVSPGVQVREIDLTNVVPAVSTSIGATVIQSVWGPVGEIVTVTSEKELANVFGTPTAANAAWFYNAAAFLKYGNNLKVVRGVNTGALNATSGSAGQLIKNKDDFETATVTDSWIAKYPGVAGNLISVQVCTSSTAFATWTYAGQFDAAPGTSTYAASQGGSHDELHAVIIDRTGFLTGTAGQVLEKYAFVSQGRDAKKADGSSNYYVNVINGLSKYVWVGVKDASLTSSGSSVLSRTFATSATILTYDLGHGADGANLDSGDIDTAFGLFADSETVDVNLLIGAPIIPGTSAAEATTITNNVLALAASRMDCVAFVSPPIDCTVGTTTPAEDVLDFFNGTGAYSTSITATSYGFSDSTAAKIYDKYNDEYIWIPLSGHMAGLCAKTDNVADAWFSPGGFTRGQLLGITKLAFNPNKAQRDDLYKKRVNPVVSFPGEGTILYGDKTLQAKPSAFDRINVRRLFIVLEKAISTAAKYQLFELNDEFTRAMFRNMTEPFLREIKGRRGITDFKVVCDATNNTGEVIDTNQFVADIYIKPARSINFITLNFIATRTGVDFNEIGG